MRSRALALPFGNGEEVPVISITFFDSRKRKPRSHDADEVDIPMDGLSVEDLTDLDLDLDRDMAAKTPEPKAEDGLPEMDDEGRSIIVSPGWSFIPSVIISKRRRDETRGSGTLFEEADDKEIIEGVKDAPISDLAFTPVKDERRFSLPRDVTDFNPETDAIIRPEPETDEVLTRPNGINSLIAAELGLEGIETVIIPSKVSRDDVYSVQLDIDDLEDKLGGGIPRGSIVLVKGKKGCGVENFLQRLVYGLVENKNKVTYISTEISTSDFIRQMYGAGYMMANHMLGKHLLYIPIDPLIERRGTSAGYIDRMIRSPKLLNDIMVIDRLSTMMENDVDENGHLKLLSFLKATISKGRTVIIVTDDSQSGIDAIQDEASAIFLVAEGNKAEGIVRINKYPDSLFNAAQEIRFKIEAGRGAVIQ